MLLITGGASDLQRLLILMLALRSMPHIAICTVRHSWLRCILLSLSPLAVLPRVPLGLQHGQKVPCTIVTLTADMLR